MVAPPIPVPESNRAWSPFDETEEEFPAKKEIPWEGEDPEEGEEEEGEDGFLVNPLTGDEQTSQETDPVLRLAERQSLQSLENRRKGAGLPDGVVDEVEKELTGGLERGAIYMTELVVDAFDIGTFGATIVLDFMIHFITLGFLNLQMIYGSWIAKGESKLIPPLNWSPLPLNGILPIIILQGVVVFLDLFVLFVTAIIGGCCLYILFALNSFFTDPVGFAQDLTAGTGIFSPLATVFSYLFST